MNRTSCIPAVAMICVFSLWPDVVHAEPVDVQLLHIVVLDSSSSMAAPDRLEAAKREIKSKTERIPPSPTTPWVVITFGSTVKAVREFSDGREKLHEFLDDVTADGGTDIAGALSEAVDRIAAHSTARQLLLYLYTDAEDNNQAAISQQEARLEKVLGSRAENGLTQTLICRRWGNANAEMVARLSKVRHLRVIESAGTPPAHILLRPDISVAGCRWVGSSIHVDLTASIAAEGHSGADLPVVQVGCTTQRVSGETTLDLIPDGKVRPFTIDLEPPFGQVPKTAKLSFSLKVCPADASGNPCLYVATLAKDQIALSIVVPTPSSPTRLLPKIISVGETTWVDVIDSIAAFDAVLSIEVDGPFAGDKPVFLVFPSEVTHFDFSPKFIRPGKNTIRLKIHSLVRPAPDPTELTFELRPPKQDVLRVEVSGPIRLQLVGPEPARLVLCGGDEVLSSLSIDSPGTLAVTPVILGAPASAVPKSVTACFTFEESLALEVQPREATLFSPVAIIARESAGESHSFFFDTVKEGNVEITLGVPSSAVHGAQYPVVQTKPAPFKRVLFIAAAALAVVCVLVFSCRFFWRIHTLSLTPVSDLEKTQ